MAKCRRIERYNPACPNWRDCDTERELAHLRGCEDCHHSVMVDPSYWLGFINRHRFHPFWLELRTRYKNLFDEVEVEAGA